MPRIGVKGQVLADLVAEFAEPTLEGKEGSGSLSPDGKLISTISQQEHNWWKAHIEVQPIKGAQEWGSYWSPLKG